MTFSENALVKNTTKEQRQIMVARAVALGSIDSLPPSERQMELYQKYINGEMELTEIKATLDKEFFARINKERIA